MSPLLFGLFIDCLERFLSKKLGETTGAFVIGKIVRVLLYADDLALVAASPEELQELLNCLSEFCLECGMQVNVRKSEVVCFNRCFAPEELPAFRFQTHTLPVKQEFKYLGVRFHEGSKKRGCPAVYMVHKPNRVLGQSRRCMPCGAGATASTSGTPAPFATCLTHLCVPLRVMGVKFGRQMSWLSVSAKE